MPCMWRPNMLWLVGAPVSAHWASQGVRINAIAPGNVETAMTAKLSPQERVAVLALPIPTLYGQEKLMDPSDIASSIVFLVSQQAHGINGDRAVLRRR